MINQDAYRKFAEQASDLPLFMQPWYLDAVCVGGNWEAVLIEKGGKLVAALPFFLKKKLHWQYIAMPQLCKFLGPYLIPEFRTLDQEMRLYEALISELPDRLAAFQQDMNYAVTNWLPFHWRGFRQSTRYSYVLSLDLPEEDIFRNISKNYRNKIQRAGKLLQLNSDRPLADLQMLVGKSFARQGLENPLSPEFLNKVYTALADNQCCRLFFAEDANTGQVHSASLLVWDNQAAYYLLSGDDPELRSSGSKVWLNWQAIRYAKNELKLPIFDFEGSMIKAIEIGRRDFGAVQRPYFRIGKEWSFFWRFGKFLAGR
ncbi:MAG: GNAT family N-acetyltransferase [Lewinellaceae bacterium]|nr:GNAT family N-acetyltransferase [Saprospiraceae bacterium]MCB9344421.1 GNAT family N-acetyltransferase [Lewinellaceae bacterium]